MAKQADPTTKVAKDTKAKPGVLSIPSVFAFRRSIDVSEGLMYSKMPDGSLEPIIVQTSRRRGAIGTFQSGYNPKTGDVKTDAEKEIQETSSNESALITKYEHAQLDPKSDTLVVKYYVSFSSQNRKPYMCNEGSAVKSFEKSLVNFATECTTESIIEELTKSYLWRIFNCSPIWRNAMGINKRVSVKIQGKDQEGYLEILSDNIDDSVFENKDYEDKGYETWAKLEGLSAVSDKNTMSLTQLKNSVISGLTEGYTVLEVTTEVTLFPGSEVWPSQEIDPDKDTREKDKLSRKLSKTSIPGSDEKQATLHSQKIGNAIRTIDSWHGNTDFGCIPVEIYGWTQKDGVNLRVNKGNDGFYLLAKQYNEGITERKDRLYLMALLIRGGVFGGAGKDKKDPAPTTDANNAN